MGMEVTGRQSPDRHVDQEQVTTLAPYQLEADERAHHTGRGTGPVSLQMLTNNHLTTIHQSGMQEAKEFINALVLPGMRAFGQDARDARAVHERTMNSVLQTFGHIIATQESASLRKDEVAAADARDLRASHERIFLRSTETVAENARDSRASHERVMTEVNATIKDVVQCAMEHSRATQQTMLKALLYTISCAPDAAALAGRMYEQLNQAEVQIAQEKEALQRAEELRQAQIEKEQEEQQRAQMATISNRAARIDLVQKRIEVISKHMENDWETVKIIGSIFCVCMGIALLGYMTSNYRLLTGGVLGCGACFWIISVDSQNVRIKQQWLKIYMNALDTLRKTKGVTVRAAVEGHLARDHFLYERSFSNSLKAHLRNIPDRALEGDPNETTPTVPHELQPFLNHANRSAWGFRSLRLNS